MLVVVKWDHKSRLSITTFGKTEKHKGGRDPLHGRTGDFL